MNKLFFLFLFLPFIGFSQSENRAKSTAGYTISGTMVGYEDGTSVSFLSDDTGQPVQQTTIEKGKFEIKGTVEMPTFKVLVFGNKPPVVPFFLENNQLTLSGNKAVPGKVSIAGSKSQEQYMEYSNAIQPYIKVLTEKARDAASVQGFNKAADNFIRKNTASFVTPLVIIQMMQVSENVLKQDSLYQLISDEVKETPLAQYVNQQLQIAKSNRIGTVIEEFSQADTSGNMVSIQALRGKYVLIDFWASWCGPCRQENPNVVAAFKKYQSKNFTVLGISLDSGKEAWLKAVQMDGLFWTQLSDLKGWQNAVAAQFHVTSIPQNLLIDPQGKIIDKNLRGENLLHKLGEILD